MRGRGSALYFGPAITVDESIDQEGSTREPGARCDVLVGIDGVVDEPILASRVGDDGVVSRSIARRTYHGDHRPNAQGIAAFAAPDPRCYTRAMRWFRPLFAVAALAVACSSTGDSPPSEPRLPVTFPADFKLGFATVGWQSEGSMRSDGSRVDSNWSRWEDLGKVARGQKNDHGNGFHEQYAKDLDLVKDLGGDSFSYALDWSRIEPKPGEFDDVELGLVVDKIKAMRARGLRPLVVLFHWVTPPWVQSPKTAAAPELDLLTRKDHAFVDAFLPFVKHVVPVLAGLVDEWVTFEEPYSIVLGEYIAGEHPPGHLVDVKSSQYALWNLMFLHGRTYHAIKELDTKDADGDGVVASVGFENLASFITPIDESSADDAAAAKRFDYILNRQFPNALVYGDIDIDMDGKADNPNTEPPESHEAELVGTLDFIGINYYERTRVQAGGIFGGLAPFFGTPSPDVRQYDPMTPHSDLYQEISSHGLRVIIEQYAGYKIPMFVSETGLADEDDDQRPYYLLDHLYTTARAAADGFDVRGFYCWTISDNFEWSSGVDARFGLFKVDFSQPGFPRTRQRSADAFSDMAHARGIDQALWDKYALPRYPAGIP